MVRFQNFKHTHTRQFYAIRFLSSSTKEITTARTLPSTLFLCAYVSLFPFFLFRGFFCATTHLLSDFGDFWFEIWSNCSLWPIRDHFAHFRPNWFSRNFPKTSPFIQWLGPLQQLLSSFLKPIITNASKSDFWTHLFFLSLSFF